LARLLLLSVRNMCGIVGIVHRHGAPVDPGVIRTMCAAIRHRGPDDEGIWVDGPVGLGMRRLSIIDVAGSRQPIASEDGSATIVYNGEVYNYAELRRGLLRRGHRFATHGDTEAILHLYEELGAETPKELRGMFAWAVWDSALRRLTIARDRFGIKPLYYIAAEWGIAFASELKALTAAGLTDRALDWDALDAYFQLGYIPAPATPFRDVRKLEPGHVLQWHESGRLTIERYWDLPRETTAEPRNVEERVLEWLDESVSAHLVSDVPVAAFLSGGLDSSAVVASMALASNGAPPHAFTARYTGSGAGPADESGLAAILARRYGAKLTVVDIAPHVSTTMEQIVAALDEPHADDSAIPTWTLSEAVGQSYKVALTGIGGDELFAGYRRHPALASAENYARLPRALRQMAARATWLLPDIGGGLAMDRLKRFVRAGSNGAGTAELYLGMLSRMGDGERASLYKPGVRREMSGGYAANRFRTLHADAGAPSGARAALYLDYHTFLADDVLALSDRLAMAHSLEIRVPFVDHELVERIFPLRAAQKIVAREPKQLLRRALASRLPPEHFKAPKRGFVGPTSAWLRSELRPMLQDELSAGRLARFGLFDGATVSGLMADHFGRRHNREAILWALLCFSTWHRLYVESAGVRRYDPREDAPIRVSIPA
jgi:asparagine synthase (glutamine-hydrolysing)